MRSRPKVKTYLRPAVATPGKPLDVEVVLTSASETPVEFVELLLEGRESVQFGRYGATHTFVALKVCHGERTLGVGEHRLRGRFDLAAVLPPTYRGSAASITYTLDVHVSIPWWPDRRQRFIIPLVATGAPLAPSPGSFLTTLEGPKGSAPFIEAALDSTNLEVGGELAGAVSIANTRQSSIRGVDLYLIGTESPRQGYGAVEAWRQRWRLLDEPPEEGKPILFRVALGRSVGPSLSRHLFELTWRVEVVAEVVWGFDARLRVPVTIVPRAPARPETRDTRRWIAPVGRERRALTWATIAERYGLANDAERERMAATVGAVTLTIELQDRGAQGLLAVASLRWPQLGLELHAERRSVTDLFVREVDLGPGEAARRFTVRAREDAQARAVLGDEVLVALGTFAEVHIDDEGATLASPGGAPTVAQLDAFVKGALVATRALAFGVARVTPPQAMAASVAAWEAFSLRRGAQLGRGAMRIRDLRLGTEVGEIATLWSRRGEVQGTALRVDLSPPLEAPLDLASPALSQQTRDLAAAITAEARGVQLGPDALEALVAGPLDDPASVEPLLEKLAELARAARGTPEAGPYR